MPVQHQPEGYNTVIPYIMATDAPKLIADLKLIFGATQMDLHTDESGQIRHAEVKIGDSVIMLAEGGGPYPASPVTIFVYVPDVDAAYQRAMGQGLTSLREPADQFYGDRSAGFKDHSGNTWYAATHVEDVSPEEMKRRMEAMAPKETA